MANQSEVAALLREIGDAYHATMRAVHDPAVSPISRHAAVLDGMRRVENACATLLTVIGEEATMALIRAATREGGT